ncbi:MAG: preprotein translocase subunit YajC [Actinomycetota bacterium]|nr:preprotein translocase subunit YajC [Actinomycetota bacterium]
MSGYVIVLVALFGLMWLLLIRPQRRRAAKQLEMQERLRAGDEILTAGGIHGTIKAIQGDVVHVEIAPGTLVRVDRRAVAAAGGAEESAEGEAKPVDGSEPVSPNES